MKPVSDPYDVGQEITFKALFLTGSTLGSIAKASPTLYVRDPSGLDLASNAPIYIVGAGAVGGDLETTVQTASGSTITLVTDALSEARMVLVGTPTSPTTVTAKVRKPDGTEVPLTPSAGAVGHYSATYTPDVDGDFFYRFTGAGTAAADGWRKFVVRPERVP